MVTLDHTAHARSRDPAVPHSLTSPPRRLRDVEPLRVFVINGIGQFR